MLNFNTVVGFKNTNALGFVLLLIRIQVSRKDYYFNSKGEIRRS